MLTIAKGANMGLMFLLELGVLFAAGYWGFTLNAGWLIKVVAGLGAPAVFIAVWALFGAGGGVNATFPATGIWRALLEIVWFGGGATLLYAAGLATPAAVFGALFVLNAVLRLIWKQA
ncbi:YrdB family protein [Nonomuraea sp. NBC_01738]|uniref:YrdB family protein n=1 Tax=Nonomuraea sp. NBC_01738 TaxID=2976003 RepID=UPI002E15BB06|nr:YrdB family protein [Nonomuraea sp. NBC_01738]